MLHAKLVREGFKVNVKVVERLYREERLWLRRTKRKKIPREAREIEQPVVWKFRPCVVRYPGIPT